MKIISKAVIVAVSVCVLAEIILRIQGNYKVYQEKIGNAYCSDYGKIENSCYHTYNPNQILNPHNDDYSYPRAINELGIRDKPITPKQKQFTRIVITGDSYTEGLGAPYDSTWPRMLEKNLAQNGINVEVIDAGRSGSDIFFDYLFYRDILHSLNPDVVVCAMNLTDYTDYIFRGGLERCSANGTTYYKKPPWYEFIYHYSHLFRAVMIKINDYPFNGIFVSKKDFMAGWKETTPKFAALLNQYKTEVEKHHAKFIVVLHITPTEIYYPYFLNNTNRKNLDELQQQLNKLGVVCFNISNELDNQFKGKPVSAYAYLNDLHFNSLGYATMGNIVAAKMLSLNGVLKRSYASASEIP